jgi:pimeloyl-ACP methyl ester carboxylesterase
MMPNNPKQRRQQPRLDLNRGTNPPEMIDLVEPGWILKALGGMFALAIVCAYVTLCVIFSHAQWQLVLHPSRTVASTPASLSLAFTEVHFGVDASGQPQLDGWWIPADEPASRTALLLHGADGSISDALPSVEALHDLHLNVLLFDYRGYGHSSGAHPTQLTMQQDTHTALAYLLENQSVAPNQLVVYGQGVGAPLALQLCASMEKECSAMILDAPDGDLLARASADPRARIVPMSMLFNERFPLAKPLQAATAPKLLISYSVGSAPQVLKTAHDPKMLAELKAGDTSAYIDTLRRFLDEYEPQR